MSRIINKSDFVVEDMLKGILKAERTLAATGNPRVVRYAGAPVQGKVGLVTGGGSGHEPTFLGYVGKNLCDAAAVGEVFSSPTASQFHDAIKAADAGRGVLCLYGNYAGDNMNVKMAIRRAQKEGIRVETVVSADDVASAPLQEREKRRGGAALVFLWKIVGARAAQGASLEELAELGRRVVNQAGSASLGTKPCTIPAVGHPNFTIQEGTMEVGVGIHGEAGIRVEPLKPAGEMARELTELILEDKGFAAGDRAAVLVSGLGATPLMEQFIFYSHVAEELSRRGIAVSKALVGNYVTSLEMMGITMSILKTDRQMEELLEFPADSLGFRQC